MSRGTPAEGSHGKGAKRSARNVHNPPEQGKLPARQAAPHDQHGEQIEKAKGDVQFDAPIDQGYGQDHRRSDEEKFGAA